MADRYRRRSRNPRLARLLLVVGTMLAAVSIAPASGQAVETGTSCRDVTTEVEIGGQSGPIAGRLCVPPGATTVQLLVHGFTYGQYYWDFPYQPEKYSYVRAANQAGYATLAIDRLGAGKSWKPLSPSVNYENHISSVHQVVQALHRGDFGSFDKLVMAGHSYGSVITYMVAGRSHDVDAIVITGGSHQFNAVAFTAMVGPTLNPAFIDPRLASRGYDPGYITTRSGSRSVFYETSNADPEVIALDDTLAQPGTLSDAYSTVPYITLGPPIKNLVEVTKTLNIPTFTINGTNDPYFCAVPNYPLSAPCTSSRALADFEKQFYGPEATVEAKVIPDSGHNLNLERVAPEAYDAINAFLDRHVGS